jgi:hypothetical protein
MPHPFGLPLRHTGERGDTVLEFAAVLPLLLILFAAIGMYAWLFWAQAAADIAAVQALREGVLNRGGDQLNPGEASTFFQQSIQVLGGENTAVQLGEVRVQSNTGQRAVSLRVSGSTAMQFGPLDLGYTFGGGGYGRMWKFFGGPPDPWE